MKASLAVARPSAAPATEPRKRGTLEQPSAARSVTCGPRRRLRSSSAGALRGLRRRATRMPKPMSAMKKEIRKIELKAAAQGQQREGGERADHRAGRVERAVHAERERRAGARALDSEIIASRGAVRMPLPSAVDAARRAVADQRRPTATRQELADRRQRRSRPPHLLVAPQAVAEKPAGEAHERGRALVHAVDDPELQRA